MSRIKTSLSRVWPTWRLHARGRADAGAALLACALSCALLSVQADAQDYTPPPPPGYPQAYAPPPPPPGTPTYESPPPGAVATANYSPEQLDQLLAPIALYPDDLLGQILMASTYPLEVVQADRWLQDPYNASLRGSTLAQALQQLPWDASVKSLVAYPQILSWMDNALDWTEAAGDAFLAQQTAVMDSVQRLRARAQSAGTLSSTPQQTVTADGQDIAIASPNSGVEYVPVYSPQSAYGPWPYPDYPPYDFYDPGYAPGTFIAYTILVPYWGWDHSAWHHHRIDIDDRGGGVGSGVVTGPPGHPGRRVVPWRHDPTHRGGVPYRDAATRVKYAGKADLHPVQSNYRGYPLQTRPAPQSQVPVTTARAATSERPAPAPQVVRTLPPMPRAEVQRPEVQRPFAAPRPESPRPAPPRPAPVVLERSLPPAMESFGRGEEVHVQEQRGVASRASPPAQAPAAAHAGGGGKR